MILLDTCTLLWLVSNRSELSPAAAHAIDAAREVFVSAASAFEIGIKHRQGKLELAEAPRAWWDDAVARLGLIELAITPAVAFASTTLPTEIRVEGRTVEHRDPGDRFLIATASLNGLSIITPDPLIAAYPQIATVW